MVEPPAPVAPVIVSVTLDFVCTKIPQEDGTVPSTRVAVIPVIVGLILAAELKVTTVLPLIESVPFAVTAIISAGGIGGIIIAVVKFSADRIAERMNEKFKASVISLANQ